MLLFNKVILVFIILVFSKCIIAQNSFYTKDFQTRAIIQVDKKLTKKIDLSIGYRARFTNNTLFYNRSAVNATLNYKASSFLKLQAMYMFTLARNISLENNYRNMYSIAAIIDKSYKKHTLKYRITLQQSNKQKIVEAKNDLWYTILRNRITYDKKWTKRISNFFAYEHFLSLNNPTIKTTIEHRYLIGLDYKFSKKTAVTIIYMLQNQLYDAGWHNIDYSNNNAGQQSLINNMVIRYTISL